ncbi:GDSL esterase/lipase At1g29670-like isoform X1 [Salvia hispanica]|uniref:GDSL esterase/lipase At1g29670-like isoform X1 n=1 Tax=Salvia hispanica TaxID=49212 RepID=UPI0020097D0C|nr:GDSL esterase/lipase At1g29670-like isoform X1 [Salvia hispanica]
MAFAGNYIPVFFLVSFFLTKLVVVSAQPFPCFFIFGDSLVDSGNNNNLNTSAKVDYPPYGVDFPYGATGRFTNGLTSADFLAKMIGFSDFIPPFAEVQHTGDVSNGVNYASGSAGIRSDTGEHLGYRISMDQQLRNHEIALSRLMALYGNESSAKQHLNKCLYYLVVGSNDYINNYYEPKYYTTRRSYTPQQYATLLANKFSEQLKQLYNLGARKIGVAGLGPLGCIPAMVTKGTQGSLCVDAINDAVGLFNKELKVLVKQLSHDLPNSNFIYIGAMDFRPSELFAPGMRVLIEACCRVERSTGLCVRGGTPCAIRDIHFFYDHFHPTEIVNRVVATASYLDILKLMV